MKARLLDSWRHVYFYICTGCGRKRATFDHERAQRKECAKCEALKPDPNQMPLL